MTSFSAQDVKSLRDRTGCGMMECKRALQNAQGDIEGAYRLLREKGLAKIEKKQHRSTTEGSVALFMDPAHRVGALVEVNTETDFAAKNSEFLDFAQELASIAASHNIYSPTELLTAPHRGGQTVNTALGNLVGKIGENVTVRRIALFTAEDEGLITGYSHMGGKISTLLKFGGVHPENRESLLEVGRDIAMHVAAAAPRYLDKSQVDAKVLAKEEAIIQAALANENKPADKIPMIARGKMAKFFEEVCLLQQKYVKEPGQTISAVLKALDARVELQEFARFQLGEGLIKKEDDFAQEVARQVSASPSS